MVFAFLEERVLSKKAILSLKIRFFYRENLRELDTAS